MSKLCEICGKGYQKANLVPRGIGNRVTRRTLTKNQPNLRTKRLSFGLNSISVQMCTSCLKKLKKDNIIPKFSTKKQ